MAENSALPLPPVVPVRLTGRGDTRLARAAADGDQRAFATIYERFHQELFRYCHAILGDPHEAQDALQSTMASALRALPGESRSIELRPWLYRVAHNESISLIRKRTVATDDAELQMPPQPAAADAFESRERLRTLVADLASLPDRQRSALVMLELSGLSHDQIAGSLGVSPGAARQLVYEARIALQDLEEGRAMECESARRAISDGDGRVLRGRKVRSHLKSCQPCADFQSAIETRSGDLGLIAPPITAVAASGVLASVLGGGSATAGIGAVGGLFTGGLGSGILGAKTLGLIAASAAVGVGLGTAGGVELPGFGSDPESASKRVPAQESGEARSHGAGESAGGQSENAAGANGQANAAHGQGKGEGKHSDNGKPAAGTNAYGQGDGNAYGQASGIPAQANGNAVGQQAGNGNDNPHAQSGQGTPPEAPPGQSDLRTAGPPAELNVGVLKKAEKLEK